MWRTRRVGVETPTSPLDGGAVAAAPGQLGGPHPGPRAGGRGRLLLFGCGSPRRSHDTARPGPCRRRGRGGRAARYGTRSLPGRATRSGSLARAESTAPARSRAALSGRSRGGRSETGGSRRGDAPPPLHPGARPDRDARWWTSSECYRGPGSGRSWRASRLNADADKPRRLRRTRRERGPAQRGRGQAGGRRCTRGRRHTRPVRPVRLGAGTGGPVAERSGDSKKWPARIFHPPPRAPPIPKWRNDAIPRTRRSRRAPESHAPATFFRPADAPGRNGGAAGGLHRARAVIGTGPAATAGVASRSPRGNHRTAPGPARVSRIRADAESAAPARGSRRGVLAGECQPEVGRTGPGWGGSRARRDRRAGRRGRTGWSGGGSGAPAPAPPRRRVPHGGTASRMS